MSDRIPYGHETMFDTDHRRRTGADPSPTWREEVYGAPDRKCHDCGAKAGDLHMPGCDMEECPDCHWQAIACWCEEEADDPE